MKHSKKISIVVPVYNAEEYIEECIRSIMAQTYKCWELLLINDGSKDKSLKVCLEYEKKDARIRVIDKQNEGVSATRNKGISLATGDYITFVDSDDYILPNYCEEMINAITGDISLVAFGLARFSGEQVAPISHRLKDGIYQYDDILKTVIDDGTLSGFTVHSSCAILFDLKIIKDNNLHFNSSVKYNEDGLFCTEYIICAKKPVSLNYTKIIYMYRINDASATRTVDILSEKYLASMQEVEKSLIVYVKDYGRTIKSQINKRAATLAVSKLIYLASKKELTKQKLKEILCDNEVCEGLKLTDFSKLNFGKKIFYILFKAKQYWLIKLAFDCLYGR